MICRTLQFPHGAVIVCQPRRRAKHCSICGRRGANKLCDGAAPKKKSGTCDAALCGRCARSKPDPLKPGNTLDLCPRCARAGPVPVQLGLEPR